MLVDSHCHLDKLEKHSNLTSLVEKAKEQGVSHMLSVCVTLKEFPAMRDLVSPFPQIFSSVGVHPLYQDEIVDEELLLEYAKSPKVVAIGETGLDFFYSPDNKLEQENSFRAQIRVARIVNKPLIVHTRGARAETMDILKSEGGLEVSGVLHCFTESLEMALEAIELGFYISVSGIVTFKNAATLQDVIKQIPIDRLLVETDSPYLTPVPHRGEENEPAFVRNVAEFVANLKGISLEELAFVTSNNFFTLFKTAQR